MSRLPGHSQTEVCTDDVVGDVFRGRGLVVSNDESPWHRLSLLAYMQSMKRPYSHGICKVRNSLCNSGAADGSAGRQGGSKADYT